MKLQEGKPFIVADGNEYLEAEPIETPGGEAAVMSDQNVSEKEKNHYRNDQRFSCGRSRRWNLGFGGF